MALKTVVATDHHSKDPQDGTNTHISSRVEDELYTSTTDSNKTNVSAMSANGTEAKGCDGRSQSVPNPKRPNVITNRLASETIYENFQREANRRPACDTTAEELDYLCDLDGDDDDDVPPYRARKRPSVPDRLTATRRSLSGTSIQERKISRLLTTNSMSTLISKRDLSKLSDDEWHKLQRKVSWLVSFLHNDPRWRIMSFFHLMAEKGATSEVTYRDIQYKALVPANSRFKDTKVFTVWRPTSMDAVRKMMQGDAVGKGLNVKGKSAKCGKLSGFIPFLQIHSNDKHKKMISTLPKAARISVFFKSLDSFTTAVIELKSVLQEMVTKAQEAHRIITNEEYKNDDEYEDALVIKQSWEMEDPTLKIVDRFNPRCYGVDMPERLFWEAFVMRRDINRPKDSPMATGRPSEPAFQDMNFGSTRKKKPDQPKTVVLQVGGHDDKDPLCPLTLLVAYEENDRVKPVASDFDAFLVGTKGVNFDDPIPSEQIEILKWCVNQIDSVLSNPNNHSWTTNWLNVLKREADKGFYPKMPTFGFGDPKSYEIMKNAVCCLEENGSVRHGAECFNYYFPQELDDEFLVFSAEGLGDNVKWKYLNEPQLQDFLRGRIEKGYVFPLNPKWVLCDHGWKDVYNRLHASADPQVQKALGVWYPPEVRNLIEDVYRRHADGFSRPTLKGELSFKDNDGTSAMDRARLELKRHLVLKRAKRKLKVVLMFMRYNARARKEKARQKREAQIRRIVVIGGVSLSAAVLGQLLYNRRHLFTSSNIFSRLREANKAILSSFFTYASS